MTPPPLVCLFCHADDEFPVFAEIDAQLAAGGRVVCIYLTDGAFYGGQSADRREAESRAVLAHMGVPQEDVHFPGHTLPIGDTKLYLHMDAALDACRAIVRPTTNDQRPRSSTNDQRPPRLLIPAWEGGHHDHDAAHVLGLLLARELAGWEERAGRAGRAGRAEVLQASLYQGKGLPGGVFRVLAPLAENGPVVSRAMSVGARVRYLRYCLSYPSQWKTWAALFPLVLLNYLLVGAQRLQRAEPSRVLERPHEGPMLYERRGFCTWETFAAATASHRNRVLSHEGAKARS